MTFALRFLAALVAVLLVSPVASSQDLSDTWLKATISARLSPLNNGASLEDGGGDPDLTLKVKPVRKGETVFIYLSEAGEPGVYPIEIFTLGPSGLISSCAFGALSVGDGGVIAGLQGSVTLTEKTKEGVTGVAFLDYDMKGNVKVKVDKEGAAKKVTMAADGITRSAGLLVPPAGSLEDGGFQPAAGSLRIRAKSVPVSKVPLLDEAPALIKGLVK